MATEKPCSLLLQPEKGDPPTGPALKEQLEKGNTLQQISALKKVILLLNAGETIPGVLMTIIRFVMTSKDHTIKKLLLLFWEVVEKTTPDGKLLPEMILVCNFLRRDLTHPNEYVRGSTLRYLCKLKEPELLEPLVPSVRANLEHRHSYVRKNAILALFSIYKNFEHLCPDAPDVIFNYLLEEGDASCKRNALLFLFQTAQEKAIDYLATVLDQVSSFSEILQLIVVEIIRKVVRSLTADRGKYIKCIFTLLNSSSPSVQFQAAGTLTTLSTAPVAIKAAAAAYITLLCNQSDNNVKMIVLDKLIELKAKHKKLLQELIMDILRALASPNMDIRKKTLDLALDLVSPRNIEEVILVLKKEIAKTQSKEFEKVDEYRQLLIGAIHSCAVKFPDVAQSVIHVLMDFLSDTNVPSALDVAAFVREVVETYADLRESILKKLVNSLGSIKSGSVQRAVLWIISQYSETSSQVEDALTALKNALGEPPFIEPEQTEVPETNKEVPTAEKKAAPTRLVLADGTYASQSALMETPDIVSSAVAGNKPTLRALLLAGDFLLGSVIASTMTKLVLKASNHDIPTSVKHSLFANALLVLTSMLTLGESKLVPRGIDSDSAERISTCIRVLSSPDPLVSDIFLHDCRNSFVEMLKEQNAILNALPSQQTKEVEVQADDLIKVRQLRAKRGQGQSDLEDEGETEIEKATGGGENSQDASSRLNRVYQLTGFSDPIYAEAVVTVHQYDILLEVTVLNQTTDTLQNVCLELATLGDLKLVERPQNYTIGATQSKVIKANIKVSSTETGIIFGNIVYDVAGSSSSDKNCVILNDIHIDIMDYINPATTTETNFRTMWQDFEWENKIAVHTNLTDVNEYLAHLLKSTNMNCLTPKSVLAGDCPFLSANLYAKSIFGEHALANVSIEKQADGKIVGFVRIRSKAQGIALSLGEKITYKQKA